MAILDTFEQKLTDVMAPVTAKNDKVVISWHLVLHFAAFNARIVVIFEPDSAGFLLDVSCSQRSTRALQEILVLAVLAKSISHCVIQVPTRYGLLVVAFRAQRDTLADALSPAACVAYVHHDPSLAALLRQNIARLIQIRKLIKPELLKDHLNDFRFLFSQELSLRIVFSERQPFLITATKVQSSLRPLANDGLPE